jgi:CheY-like chemotaxis protein
MKRRRILLVDDYRDSREMWSLFLRSQGYDVTTAADGLDAVEIAALAHPDVIVMDLDLPGITGFEAARRLRRLAATANIALIAATGYSHPRQAEQARAAGFDAVVFKPCDPIRLVAEIDRARHEAPSRAPEPVGTLTT